MTEDTKGLLEKMRMVRPKAGVAYRVLNFWRDGGCIEVWEPSTTNDPILFFAIIGVQGPQGTAECRVPLPIFDEHGVFLASLGMFERLVAARKEATKAVAEDMGRPKIALPGLFKG